MYKDNHVCNQELLANKLEVVKLIFERKLPQDKEANLIYFLFYYVNFEFSETNTTFERGIKLLPHKNIDNMTTREAILEETKFEGKREGLKEGRQLGKKETTEEIVTKMIQMQLASDDQIVEVAGVPRSLVSRLRKKVEKIN